MLAATLGVAIVVAAAPVIAVLLLPLLVEILVPRRRLAVPRAQSVGANHRHRILVLMPAHNESGLIGQAARSLTELSERRASIRRVVIADNCTDDTAEIARSVGVEVLERDDTTKRGKPAAIQWAFDAIGLEDFDSVAIVDADTEIDPDFFDHAANFESLREVAVQGYFGVSNVRDSWLSRLGELLARVRYESEYPSKSRAGLNVPLTGNGMLLGVEVIRTAGWPTDALTENWDLYARISAQGKRILLARGAIVRSQEATTLGGGSVQRRRWMAGRLQVLQRHTSSLIRGCMQRREFVQLLDALAELLSPGPILHLALCMAIGLVLLALLPRPFGAIGFALLSSATFPLVFRTLHQLRQHPNRRQLLRDILRIPQYLAWRLWTALRSISTARRGTWERSPRD